MHTTQSIHRLQDLTPAGMIFLEYTESIEHPETVYAGISHNSVASGGAVIGSHHLKLTLKPGESKSLIFVLGYSENDPEDKWEAPGIIKKDLAHAAISRFSEDSQVKLRFWH